MVATDRELITGSGGCIGGAAASIIIIITFHYQEREWG